MNVGFLSKIAICKDCIWEQFDLFHGTTGMEVSAYYCSFNPENEMK